MKKLMIATIVTLTTGMAVVQPAFADYDPVGSALLGGVAGAVIGHAVGGRNGAAVGAAIGGVGGAIIATNQPRTYYERTRVYEPAPVRTTYYAAPAPVSYYPTEYYPQREAVYPVRQVAYYGDGYRSYYHDREWNHDRGWHRDWDHDRGYYSY